MKLIPRFSIAHLPSLSSRKPVRSAAVCILACSALGALAAVPEIKPTESGRATAWTGYTRVLVKDLADRVTEKYFYDTVDRRVKKGAEVKEAVTSVPDAFAEELRKTGAFKEVLRAGSPDANTLVLSGTLWRYDEGNWDTRRVTGSRAGLAQFESRLDLRDGARDELLATITVDEGGAGYQRATRPYQSLANLTREAAQNVATALAKAKERGGLAQRR